MTSLRWINKTQGRKKVVSTTLSTCTTLTTQININKILNKSNKGRRKQSFPTIKSRSIAIINNSNPIIITYKMANQTNIKYKIKNNLRSHRISSSLKPTNPNFNRTLTSQMGPVFLTTFKITNPLSLKTLEIINTKPTITNKTIITKISTTESTALISRNKTTAYKIGSSRYNIPPFKIVDHL